MTVVVVSTGGTIAMRPDPATGKLVPAMSGDELVEMLDWPSAPPVELDDFCNVPSFDMHGDLALSLALREAIRVALAAPAQGLGALISFAGEIHAAREVRKIHTAGLSAFASPGYAPVGHVDGERVLVGRRPGRQPRRL